MTQRFFVNILTRVEKEPRFKGFFRSNGNGRAIKMENAEIEKSEKVVRVRKYAAEVMWSRKNAFETRETQNGTRREVRQGEIEGEGKEELAEK